MSRLRRVAAILLLPVTTMLVWQMLSKPDAAPMLEMSCNPGMVAQFTLPDGSKVWLNGGSKITYPAIFDATRNVKIEGQAYFEVAHNAEQPFIVSAGRDVKIKVLGTKFDVEAFLNDDRVETMLIEGSVELSIKNDKKYEHKLKPGEKSIYLPDSGKVFIVQGNVEVETAWRERRILFNKSSMSEVMRTLSHYYNADFVFRGGKSIDASITGSFSNESLPEVMRILGIASGIRYRIINDDANKSGERRPAKVEIWKK